MRTDFILSAEIIAITLGTVQSSPFTTQLAVLSSIALVMTVGVYGLVAGIVKLDDAGLYLSKQGGVNLWNKARQNLGRGILWLAPWLMKGLSVAGTAAMFLVGGGILTHGFAPLHHGIEALTQKAGEVNGIGGVLGFLTPQLMNALVGMVAGALVLLAVSLLSRLKTGQAQKTLKH